MSPRLKDIRMQNALSKLKQREGFRGSWGDAARQLMEEDESWKQHDLYLRAQNPDHRNKEVAND